MLRLIGFFLLVLLATSLLRSVPGIGAIVGSFYGFWIVAIVLSLALTRLSVIATQRRKLSSQVRALGEVESAHNQGKLGSLYLAHGRAARAVVPLERAVLGEPDVAEWRYRLGQALLACGRAQEALGPLEAAATMDEEHAYGAVQLARADARLRTGDAGGALAALAVFERNHGASPESAYWRGRALRALGRRQEARTSFREVASLARRAARFKRSENRVWVLRALLLRW